MDGENEKDALQRQTTNDSATVNATAPTRIQFIPSARPERPVRPDEQGIPIKGRTLSVASIPQVVSVKEKDRLRREQEFEKKNVDIDEHLLPHEQVAERYKTKINMTKPEESFGLTTEQAQALLQEHGPNVLTPPKKRHPFLKYLDCLSSLFNLLLILAGVLEYILLGINYKDNFQNVGAPMVQPRSNANNL